MRKDIDTNTVSYSDPKSYWDNFKQSNANWLRNFYKSRNISDAVINETIMKQEAHFKKLEEIIEKGEKEKGKYFEGFAKMRKKDMLTFKITLPDVSFRMKSKI